MNQPLVNQPLGRLRLGVNIDHVATIRNARGGDTPDPARAARIAEAAGADGITAHLREDRRHALLIAWKGSRNFSGLPPEDENRACDAGKGAGDEFTL